MPKTRRPFCSPDCLVLAIAAAILFAASWLLSTPLGIAANIAFFALLGAITFIRQRADCARRLLWSVVGVSLTGLSASGIDIGIQWGKDRFFQFVAAELDWPFFAIVLLLGAFAILGDSISIPMVPKSKENQRPQSTNPSPPPSERPRINSPGISTQGFIVSSDLYEYSIKQEHYEEVMGPEGSAFLDSLIRSDFLAKLPEGTWAKFIGDQIIAFFYRSDVAHAFSRDFLLASQRNNLGKIQSISQRHYRVGICAGEVTWIKNEKGDVIDISSSAIRNAVRLEGKCIPGSILICPKTWASLADEERDWFVTRNGVSGKPHEGQIFPVVYERKVVDPPSWWG